MKVSGSTWSVKISPLKKGTNTLTISGWNLTTNKGRSPTTVLIICK